LLTYTPANGTSIDVYFEGGKMHSSSSGGGESGRGFIALSDASVHSTTTYQLREHISTALSAGSTNVVISLPHGVE